MTSEGYRTDCERERSKLELSLRTSQQVQQINTLRSRSNIDYLEPELGTSTIALTLHISGLPVPLSLILILIYPIPAVMPAVILI